jgi:hypothetical protein
MHSMYEQGMRERRVKVLDALPVMRARTDKSRDGPHYFYQKARDGQLRKQMVIYCKEGGVDSGNGACNVTLFSKSLESSLRGGGAFRPRF